MKGTRLSLAALCLVGTTLAQAATFQRADDNAAQSLASGFGRSTLPLLQRLDGDSAATLASLQASLCGSGCAATRRESGGDVQRVSGNGWRLEVSADGSAAEFSDERARSRAHALGVEAKRAVSAAALEAAGRDYIAKHLAAAIALRTGERLVPEATYARVEGGSDAQGRRAQDRITGNRIVFTREIDGVPVVGNGSKVVITFLNDMTVESFRYDWPQYVVRGAAASTVSRDALLQRVQAVLGSRTGRLAAATIAAGAHGAALDLGGGIALERFECGYYDAGLAERDTAAPVQAGCVYHAVQTVPGMLQTRAGYSGAVPAAAQPAADARWPELALLAGVAADGASDPGAAVLR